MMFRFVSLFFLAANASAFVVNPNFVTRNSISCGPLLSSSSTLMSDTSSDEHATEESPIINGALEDDISVNLGETVEESVDASPSDDSSPTQLPETQRHTVYVGNLPFSATFQDIKDMFSEHVEVGFVNVPRNRETGKVKGFAFVDVGSEEDIAKAVEALRGAEMEGRPLRISKSLDKDQVRSTKNNVEGAKKIYVGNLPFSSTKEEIKDYFSNYGDVTDVFVPVNKFGDPRGFAFVTVKEDDVDKVIEATNGVDFMGRNIVVNLPLPPGAKPPRREKAGRMKMFVGNLSFYTTGDTLAEVFEEFGEVFDCYIPQDSVTNNSRGFGFVSMQVDAAKDAIDALDGCELDGRIISVNEARPREVKPRDFEDENESEETGEDGADFNF